MSVSVENTSNLGRRLKANIPNAELQDLLKSRMLKLSKEVRLKGFRPGKVPMQVIQKQFGSSVRQEVISEIIEKTLKDTLTNDDIKLAGRPVIDDINDKADQDLVFTATFEVFPDISLADLQEVDVTQKVVAVTESDIENMMSKLCRNMGTWLTVKKPAIEGDRLTVDFVRKLADADEETQENVILELGHHSVLPGLTEKLLGAKVDETVETEITYPEYWGEEVVKGKQAKLKITIKNSEENQPINEAELAEKLGLKDFDKAKLQEKIKERMDDEVKRTLNQALQEDVLEILLEKNEIELPQSLIDQELKAINDEALRKQQTQQPQETMTADEKNDSAIKRVKLGLLINEIIGKYKIKGNGKLLRKEVEYLAQEFGNPEEIIDLYFSNQQLLSGVERVVLLQQSIDALLKDMKTTQKSVTFDEIMNPKTQG
jgi:trigger factor